MGDTYASVGAWIHEHGHSPVGPGREIYMNNPGDVDEEDLLTEIQWPIDADDPEPNAGAAA
jgi:effector-binding domain-containing protein